MKLNLPEAFVTSDPVLASVKLDFENKEAKNATGYAKHLGQKNIQVALANYPDGQKFYVILRGDVEIYNSRSLEQVGAFIDKLKLLKGILG